MKRIKIDGRRARKIVRYFNVMAVGDKLEMDIYNNGQPVVLITGGQIQKMEDGSVTISVTDESEIVSIMGRLPGIRPYFKGGK